jgi:hypothetical protein
MGRVILPSETASELVKCNVFVQYAHKISSKINQDLNVLALANLPVIDTELHRRLEAHVKDHKGLSLSDRTKYPLLSNTLTHAFTHSTHSLLLL